MKKFISILMLLTFGFVFQAKASDDLIVAELFTSQGCMACPPANELLTKLNQEDSNLLVLSWSVDYWDYLGWEDTFAKKSHTARQAAYNKSLGKYGVFTPQIIINGNIDGIGSREPLVRELISEEKNKVKSVYEANFQADNSNLYLNLNGPIKNESLTVRIVYYSGDETIQVSYGDNNGRKIGLTNVVMASSILTKWKGGKKSFLIDTESAAKVGADCIAVLVQIGDTGPILTADKFLLTSLE